MEWQLLRLPLGVTLVPHTGRGLHAHKALALHHLGSRRFFSVLFGLPVDPGWPCPPKGLQGADLPRAHFPMIFSKHSCISWGSTIVCLLGTRARSLSAHPCIMCVFRQELGRDSLGPPDKGLLETLARGSGQLEGPSWVSVGVAQC